jgi:hypothetical protein
MRQHLTEGIISIVNSCLYPNISKLSTCVFLQMNGRAPLVVARTRDIIPQFRKYPTCRIITRTLLTLCSSQRILYGLDDHKKYIAWRHQDRKPAASKRNYVASRQEEEQIFHAHPFKINHVDHRSSIIVKDHSLAPPQQSNAFYSKQIIKTRDHNFQRHFLSRRRSAISSNQCRPSKPSARRHKTKQGECICRLVHKESLNCRCFLPSSCRPL